MKGKELDYQSYLKLLFWLSGLPEKGVPNDGYDSEKHKNQPAIVPYEKMRIQAGGGIQGRGTVIPISKKSS